MVFEHVPSVLAAPHTLLEGPCVVPGGLAYADVLAGGVFLIDPAGQRHELLAGRRGIGGLVATQDGGLVLTGRDVAVRSAGGALRVLHADPGAKGFNDLAVLDDGSVVAGVLRYRPLAGEDPVPGELLRLADGAPEVVAEDLLWPNGIAQAPDGTLLVSDFARAHVKRVGADGSVEVVHAVEDGSCDGLALDAEGALWIATGHGGCLHRVGPGGGLLAVVDVPADFVSSVCFAGGWLYVTTADNRVHPGTGGSLLRARTEIPGAPLTLAAVG